MEQPEMKFLTRYNCSLPLNSLSPLFKDINSLFAFERILLKNSKARIMKGNLFQHPKSQFLSLFKGLINVDFKLEEMIETDYYIHIQYSLLKPHPEVKSFTFTINLHSFASHNTAIICTIKAQQCNRQLILMKSIEKMNDLKKIEHKRNSDNLKFHQSTVLIGCEFDLVKKLLLDFKLFNRLIPELCTKVETSASSQGTKEGDEIKLIYDIPNHPSVVASLIATKVSVNNDNIHIVLKTKEVGLSNTPSQQIEWIGKKTSSYETCVVLRHCFDQPIKESFLERLNKEKKMIMNKMKNVLEEIEKKRELNRQVTKLCKETIC